MMMMRGSTRTDRSSVCGVRFGDYNAIAPHSALGFKSPRQYRALLGGVVYPKSVS